ncbi:hypothetical protein BC832DRAFT_593795 [Gaertneriomyces semiglobifer]|nr:hypothetical protein BC832DRAFT_593795 [Gaertneriomyces semiglobifer]
MVARKTPNLELRKIDAQTVAAINRIQLLPEQYHNLGYIPYATAQAFPLGDCWQRAIWDVDTDKAVGIVQIDLNDDKPGEHCLWRFGIDRRYQGLGYGKAAMDVLMNAVRVDPELPGPRKGLLLSYEPGGKNCPAAFYLKYGFRYTGIVSPGGVDMYYAFKEEDHRSAPDTPPPTVDYSTRPHRVFDVPSEEAFAKVPNLPKSLQTKDLALSEFREGQLQHLHRPESLSGESYANARWINWALYRSEAGATIKVLIDKNQQSNAGESADIVTPTAVGFIVMEEAYEKLYMRYIWINPNLRKRGLARGTLALVPSEMKRDALYADSVVSADAIGSGDNEADWTETVDVTSVLTGLGFVSKDGAMVYSADN